MKRNYIRAMMTLLSFLLLANTGSFAQEQHFPIEGRWDMTLHINGNDHPSWLEVVHSGLRTLVGSYVADGGSARPISKITFDNDKMSFSIPPQWENTSGDVSFEGTFEGDTLKGTGVLSNGTNFTWDAHRAPSLKRTSNPVWGTPIRLFDGKDLKGWHATGKNQWIAENGILRSPHSGSNLETDKVFNDFKLHIEFRYPAESNSGVYLRGRYEVQVVDDTNGDEPANNTLGSIYGFLAPSSNQAKKPGEWQSYDITLVGRMVTVKLNSVTIICNREIPGITGGAINSKEEDPGPILLQGDHGPIDYRNIIITPAK
jgi:3-keto-disaccharide hydrolase